MPSSSARAKLGYVPQNSYHVFQNTSDEEVVMAWLYAGAANLDEAGFVTLREDTESGGSD